MDIREIFSVEFFRAFHTNVEQILTVRCGRVTSVSSPIWEVLPPPTEGLMVLLNPFI
jgi:hypothetical protein